MMHSPLRRAFLRAVACAALAACASAVEPSLERFSLGQPPAFDFGRATETERRGEATVFGQGGRGLVTATTPALDTAPTETHAHQTAGSASGEVAREVRSRPEPRVRDAKADTVEKILSLSESLPRDARAAVERAVAVARGASDLQVILDDLTNAAVEIMRDEAYWRGAAESTTAAVDPSPATDFHAASAASSSPATDFRARGPFSTRRERVTFYWPSLGFDFAERVTPWVNAVVYLPEARGARARRFPAVAFAVGWNSWVERYKDTMRHLASHGFIVIAPTVADRRARPLFAFDLLSKHLLASLAWLVRESRRENSQRFFGKVDADRLGLLGHSSGAGAAVRAAVDAKLRVAANVDASSLASGHESTDTDAVSASVSSGIRAVAGLGAFLESSGLEHDALANLRGVALFQLAGRLDSHVAPRAVADLAAAAVHAAPRAVAVLRYGTHCFLDDASEYAYPDSQCSAARRGEAPFALAVRRDAAATASSTSATRASRRSPSPGDGVMRPDAMGPDAGFDAGVDASIGSGVGVSRDAAGRRTRVFRPESRRSVMSPAAQLEATREYVAAFFAAELGGGDGFVRDGGDDALERASASAARRKVWGVEDDDGRKRGALTHSSLAVGGAGGWGDVDDDAFPGAPPRASRPRSLSLRAASPVERTGTESFGAPPPVDITIVEDPRMSRVEVLAWE